MKGMLTTNGEMSALNFEWGRGRDQHGELQLLLPVELSNYALRYNVEAKLLLTYSEQL